MRVLITGSRHWENETIIGAALVEQSKWGHLTVVHGCAAGADTIAGRWARENQMTEECWPADWNRYGRAAGTIRNNHMVNLGADVCLAFPLRDSRGTWHCMAQARRHGIEVVNYGYNGPVV